MENERTFVTINTRSGKPMRMLNFGITTNKDAIVYINLNGFERDEVYFYKRSKDKNVKGEVKKIKWSNRGLFKEDGFRLIGVNVGVARKINEKGQMVNDNKVLTEFDACQEIYNNLKENNSVFIRGNIEYSSYKDENDELKRSVKFVPNQVSLCREINFEDEDFKEDNAFKQHIIFMGIELDDSDMNDKKARLSAKIVTYNTIENAEFIIKNMNLYNIFKKNLKPYESIVVWGQICNKVEIEEVKETDVWGSENVFDKVNRVFIRELIILGADPMTIDKETYSEISIEKAIRVLREFGSENSSENHGSTSWGDDEKSSTYTMDDEW